MASKKIALVMPGLAAGGAERVMSVLANEFAKQEDIQVHFILYIEPETFYKLSDNIIVHKLDFNYKELPRILYTTKIFTFIRRKLKEIKPDSFLSFGGKYNSLVLLASSGLGIKGFVSDRSRPGKNYGFIPDLINPFVYRLAQGIIAQTRAAKDYAYVRTKHKNITVIPNPVQYVKQLSFPRENMILNVGRFITTKNQEELIRIFIDINPMDWVLMLVGEGPKLQYCKEIVEQAGLTDKVLFVGNTADVQSYYQRSKIFAFTSTSEGFPNALAEAMKAGCACISYDCLAGPADLIEDGVNGSLVKYHDWENYKRELARLIQEEKRVKSYGDNGMKTANAFESITVSQQFLEFIIDL